MTEAVKKTVLKQLPKTNDVEVHVSHAVFNGVHWLDIRDYVISTGTYQRGVTLPWTTTHSSREQTKVAAPAVLQYENPIYCQRCGVLMGYMERYRGVKLRAYCNDTICTVTQPASRHEERDAVIELMYAIGLSPREIGEAVGITRQGVARVLGAESPSLRSNSSSA